MNEETEETITEKVAKVYRPLKKLETE